MDLRGLRKTHNADFSSLTYAKKLLLVAYCDATAETEVSVWTHAQNRKMEGWMDRQTWKLY